VVKSGYTGPGNEAQLQEGGEAVLASPPSSQFRRLVAGKKTNVGDFIFKNITMLFALLVFLLVFFMGLEMYRQSGPAIAKFGWGFLGSSAWDPVQGEYGALPFIFGTLFSSLLALLIALPLGLGVAILAGFLLSRKVALAAPMVRFVTGLKNAMGAQLRQRTFASLAGSLMRTTKVTAPTCAGSGDTVTSRR